MTFDTLPQILKEVQSTYAGPVEIAIDYMVFNLTKGDTCVRMAAIEESVWPQPSISKQLDADPSKRVGFSDYDSGGRHVYEDMIKQYYE